MSTQYQLMQAISALHGGARRLREEDPDIAIDIADDLAEEAAAVEGAIVAVCRAAREADALHDAAKRMMVDLGQRATRFRMRSQQLRGVAFSALDVLGKRRIEAADITISLRSGSQSALVTDEAKIPDSYWKTERTLNKAELLDDLKQGVVVEGAELSNGLASLMIKGT